MFQPARASGAQYDLIVLDPPSFTEDEKGLVMPCVAIVAPFAPSNFVEDDCSRHFPVRITSVKTRSPS
jgi:hypothetical protein